MIEIPFLYFDIHFISFHFRLIASIEDNRRSELRRAKQRAKAKVRQQMIGRLQKQKALSAHKSLIEASNQKIISRIEQLKTQRQAAAQLRTKQAIQQQLSKVSLESNCHFGIFY